MVNLEIKQCRNLSSNVTEELMEAITQILKNISKLCMFKCFMCNLSHKAGPCIAWLFSIPHTAARCISSSSSWDNKRCSNFFCLNLPFSFFDFCKKHHIILAFCMMMFWVRKPMHCSPLWLQKTFCSNNAISVVSYLHSLGCFSLSLTQLCIYQCNCLSRKHWCCLLGGFLPC